MVCKDCGRQLPENSRFCDGCGAVQAPKTKKKNKTAGFAVLLVLGILLTLIGGGLSGPYEEVQVPATVVEVVKQEESDSDLTWTYDSYTVYADYTLEGKNYEHVRIGKYTKPYTVGQTIMIEVSPKDNEPISFWDVLCVGGVTLIVCAFVLKKKANPKQGRRKDVLF